MYALPGPGGGFKGKGLPLFSYRDLNGLLKNESEEDFAYVFRHFELPAEGVELLAVAVERSYFIRHLLLVYKDGVLTDWFAPTTILP